MCRLSSAARISARALVAAMLVLAATKVAQAVTNGPLSPLIGPNIMYLNVFENATKFPGPTPPSLFEPNSWTSPPAAPGAETPPQVLGDDLVFNPGLNFRVEAQNGGASLADALLSMTIMTADPLDHISSLVISEGGGYGVIGGLGNFDQASLIASAPAGGLTITKLGNTSVNIPVIPSIVFNRTGGAPFTVGSDTLTLGATGAGGWTAVATYDIDAALAALNLSGNANKFTLSLDNILLAQTTENGAAFIDKKTFVISPHIVPEPATLVLAVLGSIALLAMRCRHKAVGATAGLSSSASSRVSLQVEFQAKQWRRVPLAPSYCFRGCSLMRKASAISRIALYISRRSLLAPNTSRAPATTSRMAMNVHTT